METTNYSIPYKSYCQANNKPLDHKLQKLDYITWCADEKTKFMEEKAITKFYANHMDLLYDWLANKYLKGDNK